MKNHSNSVPLIIAILVIAAGIYWYFFTGTGNQPPLTVVESGDSVQTRFQVLTGELGPISFDTSIFSDPRFNALVDLTTPIFPEASGRPDPFAPITGVSGN